MDLYKNLFINTKKFTKKWEGERKGGLQVYYHLLKDIIRINSSLKNNLCKTHMGAPYG